MKKFENISNLYEYLVDIRKACSNKWDPTGTGNFVWYVYPDYDEEEDDYIMQNGWWNKPVPTDNAYLFPAKLGFYCEGNLFFMKNFSIQGEKASPIAVFDAFDENNTPCTFAMFGEGDTSLHKSSDRIKLLEWFFEGFDDNDEFAWNSTPVYENGTEK